MSVKMKRVNGATDRYKGDIDPLRSAKDYGYGDEAAKRGVSLVPIGVRTAKEQQKYSQLMQKARGYTPPDPTYIPPPPVVRQRIFTFAPPRNPSSNNMTNKRHLHGDEFNDNRTTDAATGTNTASRQTLATDSRALPGTRLYMAFETEKKNGYAKTATLQPEDGIKFVHIFNMLTSVLLKPCSCRECNFLNTHEPSIPTRLNV